MYQTVIFLALCMKLKIISFEGFKSGISNLSSFQWFWSAWWNVYQAAGCPICCIVSQRGQEHHHYDD